MDGVIKTRGVCNNNLLLSTSTSLPRSVRTDNLTDPTGLTMTEVVGQKTLQLISIHAMKSL